jgi:hypothetical protein
VRKPCQVAIFELLPERAISFWAILMCFLANRLPMPREPDRSTTQTSEPGVPTCAFHFGSMPRSSAGVASRATRRDDAPMS